MSTFLQSVLTAGALAMAASAWGATYSTAPAEGPVNLEDNPGGVNSVEIYGSYTINREAEGFISLYQNGNVIRQVPASNKLDLYTFEGYSKVDEGMVHVTFFSVNGPAKDGGTYKMTVPAGFFNNASTGDPTEEMEFEWTITNPQLPITPAAGGHYTSLKEFKITLPKIISQGTKTEEVSSYALSTDSVPWLYELINPEVVYNSSVKLDGNVATITLDEEVKTPETYNLYIPFKMFEYTTVSGKKITSKGMNYSYYIDPDSKGAMSIVPAEGSYEEFPVMTGTTPQGGEFDYTFCLQFPEDAPMTIPLRGQVKLCPLAEDGTYDTNTYVASFSAFKASPTQLALTPIYGEGQAVSPVPGKYALVIPANLYMTAAGRNGAYYFVYEVLPNTNLKYTIEPADGSAVKSLSEITLTFEEGKTLEAYAQDYATLTNGIATYTMQGTIDEDQPNKIVYSLPIPMTVNGVWSFRTPIELTLDGASVGVMATYTVDGNDTGVSAVVYPEGDVKVFTLTGLCVAEGRLRSMQLPAGIYVAVDAEGNAVKVRF
ncbi:MAG: hypothetical protein K2O24_09155 [Muribaculaceae bacterium]|nr:hypothetical protein [Muribaculaceae bacterium]